MFMFSAVQAALISTSTALGLVRPHNMANMANLACRYYKVTSRPRPSRVAAKRVEVPEEGDILKVIGTWACVRGCGACCYLNPKERAEEVKEYLNEQEFSTYLSIAGEDGWCKHFDKTLRQCTIYDSRPRFCKVDKDTYAELYGVEEKNLDKFCNQCCKDHIADMYGRTSDEWRRFNRAAKYLEAEAKKN